MKNILHISTNDFYGAGSAALRVHKNLMAYEFNSLFLCKEKRTLEDNVIEVANGRLSLLLYKIFAKIEFLFNLISKKYYFSNISRHCTTSLSDIEVLLPFNPNVIILYWISGFIDLNIIQKLSKKYNCKVYWYLMDMAPMTGGCHYSWGCEGYQKQCESCPAVGVLYKDLPHKLYHIKENFVNLANVESISGTKWLTRQLRQSTIFKNNYINQIMLGIDEQIFKPLLVKDKIKIKNKFGIPLNVRVIFFGATSIHDDRKGFSYLLKALEILSRDNFFEKKQILLLIAGKIIDNNVMKKIDIQFMHIGYLKGDINLAKAYQIADLFVSPSIEDSGPMMVNESIMCGTPIVSFNIGVALDLVITGETGYLANLKDIKDLAYGIKYIISLPNDELNKIKNNCRTIGLNKISNKTHIKQLIKLIEGA